MKKTILTIILGIIGTMGVLGITIGGMYLFTENSNVEAKTKSLNQNEASTNRQEEVIETNSENNNSSIIYQSSTENNNENVNSMNNKVTVYIFRGEGCPHCTAAEAYFKSIIDNYDYLDVKMYETWKNTNNEKLKEEVCQNLNNISCRGVPLIIIGNYHLNGFNERFTEELQTQIKNAHESTNYTDIVAKTIKDNPNLTIVEENLKNS